MSAEAGYESSGFADLDLRGLTRRLEALERAAPAPVDLNALVTERAELVARLLEVDPHGFSTRPCQTCSAVSATLGRDFGCTARMSVDLARREGAK
jgi:hypothetical protein